MKDKPDLQDQIIINALRETYGLDAARIEFLPIGDFRSAKYRIVTDKQAAYFLKLRRDGFRDISVTVPNYLYEQGIYPVICALRTKEGHLWTTLDSWTCILYPYVAGQNGFQHPLSDEQWKEFGAALNGIHSISLALDLRSKIPGETFSPTWRAKVRDFLDQVENSSYEEPVAAKMADILQNHRDEIRFAIHRAEGLAQALQSKPLRPVLCHADIHAGNLLLEPDGALYITDWDDLILAPKERDLMFIGGGIGGIWNTKREEALFYRGYGEKDINLTALAYYRFERIVSDIGEFCQQILATTEGGADRERSLLKFSSAFDPTQPFDMAYQTDRKLKGGKNDRS